MCGGIDKLSTNNQTSQEAPIVNVTNISQSEPQEDGDDLPF